MTAISNIFATAVQLPEADRLAILSPLLEATGEVEHSLNIDDDAFIEEMQRHRNDPADSIPWSQLRDQNLL